MSGTAVGGLEVRDPSHRRVFVLEYIGGLDNGYEVLCLADFSLQTCFVEPKKGRMARSTECLPFHT